MLAYRLAAETGLRVNEIASLRVSSFDLDEQRPTVRVLAADAKSRREDLLPLRPTTALFRARLAGRAPFEQALPCGKSWPDKAAGVLQADYKLAGIPYRDAEGRKRDFHAFRGWFATYLDRGGVREGVRTKLVRHTDPSMTRKHYLRVVGDELREALDVLPNLDEAEAVPAALTGTDAADCPRNCPDQGAGGGRDVPSRATPNRTHGPEKAVAGAGDGGGGGNRTRVPESVRAERLRV